MTLKKTKTHPFRVFLEGGVVTPAGAAANPSVLGVNADGSNRAYPDMTKEGRNVFTLNGLSLAPIGLSDFGKKKEDRTTSDVRNMLSREFSIHDYSLAPEKWGVAGDDNRKVTQTLEEGPGFEVYAVLAAPEDADETMMTD